MMAMTKLLADVLKLSPSRFNPTPHVRFLAVHLGHAIVRIKTSTMVKTRYAHHQASTCIQAYSACCR
jgi:hypothetical protein